MGNLFKILLRGLGVLFIIFLIIGIAGKFITCVQDCDGASSCSCSSWESDFTVKCIDRSSTRKTYEIINKTDAFIEINGLEFSGKSENGAKFTYKTETCLYLTPGGSVKFYIDFSSVRNDASAFLNKDIGDDFDSLRSFLLTDVKYTDVSIFK